jgi:threonine dehydrogenase-like Zn-dependent dehydrogenase
MFHSLAAVQTGVRAVEMVRFPVPDEMEPGYGLLRVEASGMCGTDVSQYQGHTRKLGMYEYPAVLGHEAVGHIAALSPEAQALWGVSVGDRVAIEPAAPCTRCAKCDDDRPNLCTERFVYGFKSSNDGAGLWGAYSEFMLIHPGSRLHSISPNVPIKEVALFNAIAGGIDWTVRQSGLRPGEDVVLLAPGIRTLAGIIGARRAGARNIIVVGRGNARKAELAHFYGATHVLDSSKIDVAAAVREITGSGAQRIIDFTPNAVWTLEAAVEMAEKGATILIVGLKGQPAAIDLDKVMHKALTIKGTNGPGGEGYVEAVALINSRIEELGLLHTHSFSIAEAEAAIRTLGGELPSELALGIMVTA